VEAYLELRGYHYERLPDALYRSLRTGSVPIHVQAQIAHCIRGRQDLTIFERFDDYNMAMALELKSAAGKMSPHQLANQMIVNTKEAHSYEEAVLHIDTFISRVRKLRALIGAGEHVEMPGKNVGHNEDHDKAGHERFPGERQQ